MTGRLFGNKPRCLLSLWNCSKITADLTVKARGRGIDMLHEAGHSIQHAMFDDRKQSFESLRPTWEGVFITIPS
jgi:hypothetical protein